MTEYDFSPQAHQRYLANMNRIARWVDQTEHHRSEFADAAALLTPHSMESRRRENFHQRLPPLHLPPFGQSYPYHGPSRSASSSSSSDNVIYADGPLSPGRMPMSMFQQPPVQAYSPMASPHTPHPLYFPHTSPRRLMSSHSHGSPTYLAPPPVPFNPYSAMAPGFVIVPPGRVRKGKSSAHRRSKSHARGVSASLPIRSPR